MPAIDSRSSQAPKRPHIRIYMYVSVKKYVISILLYDKVLAYRLIFGSELLGNLSTLTYTCTHVRGRVKEVNKLPENKLEIRR